MTQKTPTYGAAILAGGPPDRLAQKMDVPHKALIPLDGGTVIDYVVDAVRGVSDLEKVIVVAHREGAFGHLDVDVPVVETTGNSFVETIETAAEALPDVDRLILCTCDVPMLEPQAVAHFIKSCTNSPEADVAWAIVEEKTVRAKFPHASRTFVKLTEARFTGGALAMMTRGFLSHNFQYLRDAYARRKNIFALGNLLGWRFVVKLLLRRLSLVRVLQRAEQLLDCQVLAVISPYASVAFDIDGVKDLAAVREWAQTRD
ncbi:MAG: nucleotidyltransferase family protein [Armatimonadota bacterium]